MALCSNATSLFELAFGINAVYAVLSERVSSTKSKLADLTVMRFQALDPSFTVPPSQREFLEEWTAQVSVGFRIIRHFGVIPKLLSLFIIFISAATLLQAAIWGEKCKIDDHSLIATSAISLVIAPLTYYFYGALLSYLTRVVARKEFKTQERISFLLEGYRISLEAKYLSEKARAIVVSVDRYRLKQKQKAFGELILKIKHPFRTAHQYYRRRKLDRLYKQLDSDKK